MKNFRLLLLSALVIANSGWSASAEPAALTAGEPAGQVIDGFGACIGEEGRDAAVQALFFDDLGGSVVRMDVSPRFAPPFSDDRYHSPWFYRHHQRLTFPPNVPADSEHAGGPEKNNVRAYTGAADYSREFGGRRARIAVMGADIDRNIALLDVSETGAIALFKAGLRRVKNPGELKLIGSVWSPAPWVKVSSGNRIGADGDVKPRAGTPWPFVWGGNFAGGRLDTSGSASAALGGTSALEQFARGQAAYLKGLQDRHGVKFYAVSVQNELGFEEFYSSCRYPRATDFIAALKALRTEFDQYPDLRDIRLIGPEDLLGGDAYSLWQYGGGAKTQHKNLQYLRALSADAAALAALDFVCLHGYSPDGKTAVAPDPLPWRWWADGWRASPAPGVPADIQGFRALGKKSWMTETSGEENLWRSPSATNDALSLAVKIHQALTAGHQSAWLYWQLTAGDHGTRESLTGKKLLAKSPKYIAAKHFFKYIRPGAVRLTVSGGVPDGVMASAYKNVDDSIVMVLINTAGGEREIIVPPADGIYRSTAENLWWDLWHNTSIAVDLPMQMTLPSSSVTTIISDGSD